MQGLIGKKIGMTSVFDKETGESVPVTIIQIGKNVVHQVKTTEKDGYTAAQLGFDACKEKRVTRPRLGHFNKLGTEPTRVVREFGIEAEDSELAPGQKVGIEIFDNVEYVDVSGTTKGRGYTGTIKRHNFQRGRETHGNTNHRDRGSLGAGTYPARVFPGLKMAGHYGAEQQTIKGLEIFSLDKEEGLVLVKGSVPGRNKGYVFVKKNLSKSR
ncbi:MAG: 50S ribosomal protein L3 [Chitinivibrionales bacterium]|nr:50S ribosomal protein L3 [Chitinivibrionales bacterium]